MPSTLACLDGVVQPADEARVSIWDRGFLLGDAIYEVFRLYRGRCWLEDAHLARLGRSLEEVQIRGVDLVRLSERVRRTITESGVSEGIVYIQLTRGVAPRTHAFPNPPATPTELIVVRPYDDAATERMRQAGAAAISHPDLRWKRCDIKSTNLLANVLANEAAHRAGAIEAVLVDEDGRVSEATHSSLLWVRNGRLEATPESPGILPGTTRRFLLSLAAEEGLVFRESEIFLPELLAADEVLICGTTVEVMGLITIDGRPIADGRPGPLTRRLQAAFRRAVEAWLG